MLTGYDLDGVVFRGVKPQKLDNAVYISGRMYDCFDALYTQLDKHPIYIRPIGSEPGSIAAGKWKAAMINLLGVKVFYEDEPIQLEIIKRECPQCYVKLVVDGKVTW